MCFLIKYVYLLPTNIPVICPYEYKLHPVSLEIHQFAINLNENVRVAYREDYNQVHTSTNSYAYAIS